MKQGFIEEVTKVRVHDGIVHYIPHFPVFKENLTTKMRIVYDASTKQSRDSPCLNDCLYTGPNLLQELSEILIKFRVHKIALIADIEKAFLQIEINPKDRAVRSCTFTIPTASYSSQPFAQG